MGADWVMGGTLPSTTATWLRQRDRPVRSRRSGTKPAGTSGKAGRQASAAEHCYSIDGDRHRLPIPDFQSRVDITVADPTYTKRLADLHALHPTLSCTSPRCAASHNVPAGLGGAVGLARFVGSAGHVAQRTHHQPVGSAGQDALTLVEIPALAIRRSPSARHVPAAVVL